jgi:hypothetical protein
MAKLISFDVDAEHTGDVLQKIIDLSLKENDEECTSSTQTERTPRSIQITITEQL